MDDKQNIIEALIFGSDSPIPTRKIKEIIGEATVGEINKTVKAINKKYDEIKSPFQVIEVAGGFQIVTRPAYSEWLRKLYISRTKNRLTQRALETLAIIAYKQPITRTEMESIRGVNVDAVVRTLIERKLITVTGREKAPGNPLLYGTTKHFLEYFGLKDISDLPKLKEIDELLKNDKQFLESLDQVSLQEMLPEELGIKSMLKKEGITTSDLTEQVEEDISDLEETEDSDFPDEDEQEDTDEEKTE
jgi:segregation and condensation protein B